MVLFATVGVALSVRVRSPEVSAGIAVAFVVITCFIDVITSAAGVNDVLRWLCPMAMIEGAGDSASCEPAAGVAYFVVLSGIGAVAGAGLFHRRDIYAQWPNQLRHGHLSPEHSRTKTQSFPAASTGRCLARARIGAFSEETFANCVPLPLAVVYRGRPDRNFTNRQGRVRRRCEIVTIALAAET